MLTNQLTSPISGIVYQRDNNNKALVPVVGKSQYGTSVTITLTPVGSTKNPIKRTFKTNADGTYSGAIETPGGWYSLQSVDNTGQVFKIDTVGVGEVFILFGHSYMQGGHDVTHQLPSTDSRVRTLYDDLTHRNFEYGQLIVKVGPFHDWPDGWGQLGDLLVKRLNVPVLFYGCAYGGSNLEMNLKVINNQPLVGKPPGYPGPDSRQPFAPLENVLTNYVPKTGVRAILAEHGYNDRGTSRAVFTQELKDFFGYVRTNWKMASLPVVLVQEQLTIVGRSLGDIPTAQGQQDFIATFPAVWKGPDFNAAEWNGKFDTKDHLYGDMIDLFAKDWSNSLTDGFFSVSTPYPATDVPVYIPEIVSTNPATGIQAIDWILLLITGIMFVLFFIKLDRKLGAGFFILALLCLYRLVK